MVALQIGSFSCELSSQMMISSLPARSKQRWNLLESWVAFDSAIEIPLGLLCRYLSRCRLSWYITDMQECALVLPKKTNTCISPNSTVWWQEEKAPSAAGAPIGEFRRNSDLAGSLKVAGVIWMCLARGNDQRDQHAASWSSRIESRRADLKSNGQPVDVIRVGHLRPYRTSAV